MLPDLRLQVQYAYFCICTCEPCSTINNGQTLRTPFDPCKSRKVREHGYPSCSTLSHHILYENGGKVAGHDAASEQGHKSTMCRHGLHLMRNLIVGRCSVPVRSGCLRLLSRRCADIEILRRMSQLPHNFIPPRLSIHSHCIRRSQPHDTRDRSDVACALDLDGGIALTALRPPHAHFMTRAQALARRTVMSACSRSSPLGCVATAHVADQNDQPSLPISCFPKAGSYNVTAISIRSRRLVYNSADGAH